MYGRRNNRSRYRWGGGTPDTTIAKDEKLVAFRMSAARYEQLKECARKNHKSVVQLINEVLDAKLKLSAKVAKTVPAEE